VEDLIFHESVVEGEELTRWIRSCSSTRRRGASAPNHRLVSWRRASPARTLLVVGADIAHSRMVVFPDDVAPYQTSKASA